MSFGMDLLLNVASALCTAAIGIAVVAQVKAKRVDMMFDEIEQGLDQIVAFRLRRRPVVDLHDFLFTLKSEMLKVKAEIVADTSRGLRLSRHLQKRLDRIVTEIDGIETDHLGVLLLGVLFESDEGKTFVAQAAKIKCEVSRFREDLYFLAFLAP